MPSLARFLSRALACASVSAAALLIALPPSAAATLPVQTAQAPGFYRMALDELTITALYDGYVDLDPDILTGASAQDIQSLLAAMFVPSVPDMQTAINGYLIHTGKQLILVDTGAGSCFGPTAGTLADNLRAAGYDPSQVDAVLLTHLHPDHTCGLLAGDGKPRFPHAQIYAARADADFWLSPTLTAQAPDDARPMFEMAQKAVAPYQASGKFLTYQYGDALPAGIKMVPTPGHTPGHTAYLFESARESLLVWGDIVHSHAVQFARPEVAIEFDVDGAQAIATRKKVFADAARDKLWIAGAHMPFPGIGHVRISNEGYAWVPAEYGPLRPRAKP